MSLTEKTRWGMFFNYFSAKYTGAENAIIRMEAVMTMFTVQAVYEKGVLKPKKALNLPENSLVELRVKVTSDANARPGFASLLGIWESVDELELEQSLDQARRKSKARLHRLAKTLK